MNGAAATMSSKGEKEKETQRGGQDVLIVGAGIIGLLFAQGLKKRGIPFQIFEREEAAAYDRAREWGVSIQWGLPLLRDILPVELLPRLQDVSVNTHAPVLDEGNFLPVYDAATGEHMKSVPLNDRAIRVSRRKMRGLCSEGLDVQYGKKLERLSTLDQGSVDAHFSDGTSARGSLIIAADGANSTVRNLIFPDGEGKSYRVPFGGVNMHVVYKDSDPALLRSWQSLLGTAHSAIGVHPKGHWLWLSLQDVPDPSDPAGWTWQLQWTWDINKSPLGGEAVERSDLEKLQLEAQSSFHPSTWRDIWTEIPAETAVPVNRISIWQPLSVPSTSFLHGRLALIGDAAHAMNFHRGQGLNHGIADVSELLAVLAGEKGLEEYEEGMVKRAGEEVALSKTNAEMMHDWARLMESPFMQRGGLRH